ncbi:MAG: hypothetical protein JWP19_2124 [Rhodoglobus sp.]|nr:hypothetical protein [Rhodoglobus sp.]
MGLELGTIGGPVDALLAVSAPAAAARAGLDIREAMGVLARIESEAHGIGGALSTAAEGYGFVERFVDALGIQFTGVGAALAGTVLRAAAVASPLAFVAANLLVRGLVASHVFSGGSAPGPSGPHTSNGLLTNPLAVGIIRDATMSVDDSVMAAAGMPAPLASFLGDAGLGVTGLAFASTAIMGAGTSVGLLTETPVRLVAEHSRVVTGPPAGFEDRLSRVPDPATDNGAQVVVEKYSTPGEPDRFEVYIAGTVTFSPEATTEPWDMTSNMSNAAGDRGGSVASVVEAMRSAGVVDSSPVQLTGYSQGGGTAARIAASGDFNIVGLTTFGGPTGQVPIPADVPTVIVEHSDDMVPALGGVQANQQALIVEREVFAGRDIPTDYAVPAHHIEYYEQTARLMDAASSDQVTRAASRLDAFGAGAARVTSTAYTFERVDTSGRAG